MGLVPISVNAMTYYIFKPNDYELTVNWRRGWGGGGVERERDLERVKRTLKLYIYIWL